MVGLFCACAKRRQSLASNLGRALVRNSCSHKRTTFHPARLRLRVSRQSRSWLRRNFSHPNNAVNQKIKLASTRNAAPFASLPFRACCRRQPDHPWAHSTAAKAPSVLALPRPRTFGHQGAALGAVHAVRHVVSWTRNSPDRKVRAGRRLHQTKRAGIPAGPRAMKLTGSGLRRRPEPGGG